jgi:hypothetical protein
MLLFTGEQTLYEHKRANDAEKFLCITEILLKVALNTITLTLFLIILYS